nr:hypothetical protein [Tanacetum cinerariifolium]
MLSSNSLRSQLETQKTQFSNEIDRLSREYYYADHMNAILGVYTELDKDLKAQLQDKGTVISKLKKLIEKLKVKSVDTMFGKSSVIRQPNAFKSQRPSVLGEPTTFSNSFVRKDFSKSKSVTQNNVSNDFSKPVTAQTLPSNKKSILKNTNVLAPGMYKLHTDHNQARKSQLPQDSKKTNKRVSFSTEVIPTTSVSIPHLKSNPVGDSVLHNNSQGKKKDVEDHHRSVKFSKSKTSVTACNDSLNAKTLNVNSVCATCDTCVLNEKHDTCILNSVAKTLKKTVASESNQKPRNITRKLYERVSKTCSIPSLHHRDTNGNLSIPLCQILHCLLILLQLVEIVLFIVDSGCSKHMTGNLKLLINFVEKFLGTVKFRNNQIAPILRYGDLEVTCYIRDLKGNGLLTGSRGTNLYSITLQDINCPNPICLMAKASSSQAWLWHRRLSHVNFDTIKLLSKNDTVMFDELLNGSSKVVSKSSTVCSADAPNQRQQHTTLLNNHTTPSPTCQVPTLAPTVTSSKNINQAETYAENNQVTDDEFINIFCTPIQNQGETSSRHVDSSNMHTFY